MKLDFSIDPNNEKPYEKDIFHNRKNFGRYIKELLKQNVFIPVMNINSSWGNGKTTFANMRMKDLENESIQYIYYDAYEHDFQDAPFISFAAKIIHLADNKYPDIKSITTQLKNYTVNIAKNLVTKGVDVAVGKLTNGLINTNETKNFYKDTISTKVNLKKSIEQKLKNYHMEKNTKKGFREELIKIGKKVRDSSSYPLII